MDALRIHRKDDRVPALKVADLSIEFAKHMAAARVVDRVSLEVWPGEIVGIIGESGSGKTLTALSILRLLPRGAEIAGGIIELDGRLVRGLSDAEMRSVRGNSVAFIPQDAMQALNPTLRISRQVGEPLEIHTGLSVRRAAAKAVELLRSVHLRGAETRAAEYPHQFSGGMQQRAMIAMGLALNPQLLIADEPTTALDVTVQAQVLGLFREIRDVRGASILFITHDLGIVAELCDWVYVMRNGRVVEDGSVDQIFTTPRADYTRLLIATSPSIHAGRLAIPSDGAGQRG